jgi:hypothetical protein
MIPIPSVDLTERYHHGMYHMVVFLDFLIMQNWTPRPLPNVLLANSATFPNVPLGFPSVL